MGVKRRTSRKSRWFLWWGLAKRKLCGEILWESWEGGISHETTEQQDERVEGGCGREEGGRQARLLVSDSKIQWLSKSTKITTNTVTVENLGFRWAEVPLACWLGIKAIWLFVDCLWDAWDGPTIGKERFQKIEKITKFFWVGGCPLSAPNVFLLIFFFWLKSFAHLFVC